MYLPERETEPELYGCTDAKMIISPIPLDSFILAWDSLVSGIGTKSSSNGFQFDKTTLQFVESARDYLCGCF